MKNKAKSPGVPRRCLTIPVRKSFSAFLTLCGLTAALEVQAANGIWTNAPASGVWTNALNWIGGVVPGTINNTANNGVDSTSIALFTNAITTYGGGANPVIPDDGTVANGKSRMLGQVNFDGANCGAYVFSSPSAYAAQTADLPETGVLSLCVNATTGSTNGSYIGAAVTTPQAFLIPVQIRLPSSTDGFYGFTNNATSPLGTFYFSSIFLYPGGTSRGITFIFDGSNTGTNTVASLSQSVNQSTGTCGVRKLGAGRWIFSGPNTFKAASPITVYGGTLEVKDPGAFGLSTAVTVTNSTLQIDGVSLNTASITLQQGGVILVNGSITLNGITMANILNTSATVATTSASDVLTIGNAVNKVTGTAITSTLHMSGPGTIVLDAGNNFAGKFSVDTGTNQLTDAGALGAAANYNINAGAVLDVTPITGGGTYSLSAKAISANGTGTNMGTTASTVYIDPAGTFDFGSKAMTLTYTPATTNGDLAHPTLFAPQGALNFNGNAITVVNASSLPLNAGTYRIVHAQSGVVTSSGAFVTIVTGSGLAPGLVGEIVASGGDLNLLVYAYVPKALVWTGNDPLIPATWDRQISTNWLNGATPSVFNIYDSALFNATGISQATVNIASTLVPGSVTVDTSAGSYTLTSSTGGQIAGGTSLVKVGANTLVLNTANTYSGGTVVSNGVLQVGTDNAIPSTGLGDVTNISPAVIDLHGRQDTIGALDGNGTIDVSSGSSVLSVGGNDNSGTFTGILTNSGGTLGLTKVGLGTQIITRSNSYAGTSDVELGVLKVTDPYSLGGGISPLVVNGGTLDIATNIFIPSLAGAGGTIANNSTTTTNIITVSGGGTTTFGGSIVTGNGKIALRVLGGSLRMTAANTYSNGTFVGTGATFQIHNSPAAVTGALVASNGATLGLSGGSSSPGTPTTVTTVDGAL
ncbi:MAG TPA: autotransporter-associated beta strand repeat-containing protein, partial [Verrucomicrobiae bacterium]|nr:autotransporter-associated beta strand repeat-containing protein [Verrucomicrobiae bacterium]